MGAGWSCPWLFGDHCRRRPPVGRRGLHQAPGSSGLGTRDTPPASAWTPPPRCWLRAPRPCPGARGLDAEGGWRLLECLPNRVSSVAFDGSAGAEPQPSPAISWSLRCPVGKAGREVPDSGSLSNLTLSLGDEWPGV